MSNKPKLKKISEVPYENKKGDKKTATESLTQEQIKDLCDGYIETSFNNLKLLHHIRYFVLDKKTKKTKFRTGGTILKIYNENGTDEDPKEKKYVVLSASGLNWTVQKEGTIFFQAKSLSQIEEELNNKYKNIIAKQTDEITTLNKYITSLEQQIEKSTKKTPIKKNK